jgi:hypothetical protein
MTGETDFLLPSDTTIRDFRKQHGKKLILANLLLGFEWEPCSLIIKCEGEQHWLLPLHVQTIHDYHREALLCCMRNRSIIAMALMRMACELARDTFQIAEDPSRGELWLDRSEPASGKRGKTFRFDLTNSGENY